MSNKNPITTKFNNENNIAFTEDKLNEYMLLGEQTRSSGNINTALSHYHSALEIAKFLDKRVLQVDILCNIASIYITKSELDKCIYYTDKADELIMHFDYMEGKLEISLRRMEISYLKQEYHLVRELGNEALKFCGDTYILHKGRILIVLAEVYSEITEVDEHMSMLNEALKCCDKANNIKGKLTILNNMASAYADKLQDNKRAMEYYTELKNLSDTSNILVFSTLAYINIGEILLKELKYKEALSYLSEGLIRAKKASLERLVFYSYCHLIEVCMKLHDYESAFHYFELADEELNSFPQQGGWLIHYYRAASLLFFEIGELEESLAYIKKAINFSSSEDSIVQWKTGFVYELIKLRTSKSEANIADGLERVKFILSHYKNSDEILDKAFTYAIELVNEGYMEYARELFKEYKDINYTNNSLKLKEYYIQAMLIEDDSIEKIQILNKALDMANSEGNKIFQYRLCWYLGRYYKNIYIKMADSFVSQADEICQYLIGFVPEQYRSIFKNTLVNI